MEYSDEELLQALQGHRTEIVELDEWRPLMRHVKELIRLAKHCHWYYEPTTDDWHPGCGAEMRLWVPGDRICHGCGRSIISHGLLGVRKGGE